MDNRTGILTIEYPSGPLVPCFPVVSVKCDSHPGGCLNGVVRAIAGAGVVAELIVGVAMDVSIMTD